jgi:4-hydroxy-2-oxoheptanedioate aldolase
VTQIISKVREKGLGVGIHFSEGAELQIKWAQSGATIIIHSSDIALFQQRLKADITEIRRALGEQEGETKDKKDIII